MKYGLIDEALSSANLISAVDLSFRVDRGARYARARVAVVR